MGYGPWNDECLDLVRGLPAEIGIGGFRCRHAAGPDADGDWFVGRTHEASLRETPRGRRVNCGSVGRNRRRLDAASFALYDDASGAVPLKELPYDAGRLLRELESRRYPAA